MNGAHAPGACPAGTFIAGIRAAIVEPRHPWHGEIGTLIEYGPYGPKSLGMTGWKLRLPNGFETYARPRELQALCEGSA